MLNKDKRSIILSLVLGDGCLHKTSNPKYTALTVTHGVAQSDYTAWKASLASKVIDREVRLRTHNKGSGVQFSFVWNRLKAWRKFVYKNGKKDISLILPYIRHPELAIAIWLMDDGYVEPSFSKLATGEKKNYGARLRIFTCDQEIDSQERIITWFNKTLNIVPKVHWFNKKGKKYPFIKINQNDSLIIWEKIREHVLQFKSMQYKFRYLEQIYQSKLTKRIPTK